MCLFLDQLVNQTVQLFCMNGYFYESSESEAVWMQPMLCNVYESMNSYVKYCYTRSFRSKLIGHTTDSRVSSFFSLLFCCTFVTSFSSCLVTYPFDLVIEFVATYTGFAINYADIYDNFAMTYTVDRRNPHKNEKKSHYFVFCFRIANWF